MNTAIEVALELQVAVAEEESADISEASSITVPGEVVGGHHQAPPFLWHPREGSIIIMAQGPGQGAAVQRPRSMASAGDLQQERRRRKGGPAGAWLKPESWHKVVGCRIVRLLRAANVYVCCILQYF